MAIYKILTDDQWRDMRTGGQTLGAPIDLKDGFVHLSTADQVAETAAKHFAGQDRLWLLAVDDTALGDTLKWEPSRGGALFPHLYAPLRMEDVTWVKPLPLDEDGHRFPEDL